MPTPPRPITSTVAPSSTLAVLSTAPTPVCTAQPITAAMSSGMSSSILTAPILAGHDDTRRTRRRRGRGRRRCRRATRRVVPSGNVPAKSRSSPPRRGWPRRARTSSSGRTVPAAPRAPCRRAPADDHQRRPLRPRRPPRGRGPPGSWSTDAVHQREVAVAQAAVGHPYLDFLAPALPRRCPRRRAAADRSLPTVRLASGPPPIQIRGTS